MTAGGGDRERAIRALAILDTPPEGCFDQIARLAAAVLGRPLAGIAFFDRDRLWFKSAFGFEAREFSRRGTCWDDAFLSNEVLVVQDALSESRFSVPITDPPVRSIAAMPLQSRGAVVGTLAVMDAVPKPASVRQIELIGLLARQTEDTLELRRRNVEAQHALNSLKMLRSAVHRTTDAIMVTEAEPLDEPGPRIVYVNPAFTRITGYPGAEVVGRSPRFLQGPETSRAAVNRIRSALENAEPVEAELLNYRRDGSRVWVELSIAPVFDDSERLVFFVSVQRDISHRKELERRSRKTERLNALQRLAGGIAHNINNQLTVISGYSHMLLEEAGSHRRVMEYMPRILQSSEAIARISTGLLQFSKHSPTAPRPIEVNQFMQNLYPSLQRMAGDAVRVELSVSKETASVQIAFDALNTLLEELVRNAIEAVGEHGTVRITTTVGELQDGGEVPKPGRYVSVTVADTGGGMDPEALSKVFEPFFSTKGPGRGTGLATAYGLATKSGGDITIESLPGMGTIVTVNLPLIEVAAPAAAEATAKPGHLHILLVEDHAAVGEAMAALLRKLGHSVEWCRDAESALARLNEERAPFHLLITDVGLPRMSGTALLAHVHTVLPGLPCLCVSGCSDALQIEVGTRGVPVLHKPFGLAELREKVREALSAR